jgi:hypothetical protein
LDWEAQHGVSTENRKAAVYNLFGPVCTPLNISRLSCVENAKGALDAFIFLA